MLPAKDVSIVLPFLVSRFFSERENAVPKDIEGFFTFLPLACSICALSASCSALYSSSVSGLESPVISPSRILIMREEYFSASSGLCVTIIISLSLEIFLSISITCTLVTVSSAPVGSSARIISGSFTSARAMATRCICPPDISLGRLFSCDSRPTSASAFFARSRRSAFETPERVSASSTFCSTVWCGIRL